MSRPRSNTPRAADRASPREVFHRGIDMSASCQLLSVMHGSVRDPLDPVHNQGLVWFVAKQYAAVIRGTTLTIEDLVQEGTLGLMRARETYEPSLSKFSTYAALWIRQAIRRAIQNQIRTVRVPSHAQTGEKWRRYPKANTPLYVKRKSGSSTDIDVCIVDLLPQRFEPERDAEDGALTVERAKAMRKAVLKHLDAREQFVIRKRYWEDKTLQEIGDMLTPPLSRERVRQIEATALEKMRGSVKPVQ